MNDLFSLNFFSLSCIHLSFRIFLELFMNRYLKIIDVYSDYVLFINRIFFYECEIIGVLSEYK